MKTLITLSALLALTSCGKFATKKDLNKVKDRVETLEEQINALDEKASANIESMNNLSITLGQVELEAESEQNSILAMIETLQEQTTELLAKQAALELENRVVGIYDPCPSVSSNSFKESLFLMSSGQYVAYFENGNKRFLTVLKPNTNYRTTDDRACVFSL